MFSVNTDGTSPSLVSNIGALAANGGAADGSLTVVGSNLYGTIDVSYGDGVIFSAPIAGGAATLLTTFSGANGASPRSDLIYANGNLYGTTYSGGAYGDGTVFSEPLSGGSPTVLTSFNGSDGGNPIGGLVLVGNTLYGTTEGDVDPNDAGTVFSLPVTGGTPTTLATFDASGDNGSNPQAGLVYDGQGHLYGETPSGGVSNDGTVFEITVAVPEPSGFSVLALGAASLLRRPRKQTAGS